MSLACGYRHIYRPIELHKQGLDAYVVEQLQLECAEADLSDWQRVVDAQLAPSESPR